MIFLICSCSCISPDNDKWANIEIPEDEIVLISRYTNGAWGYVDKGTFICSSGKVYSFDFSKRDDAFQSEETGTKFIEKIRNIKKSEKPCMCLDMDNLKQLYYYSGKINKIAEFKGEYEACDKGEDQLYICNNQTDKLVLCWEEGDYTGKLKDRYADKLISFFNENLRKNINDCISEKSD